MLGLRNSSIRTGSGSVSKAGPVEVMLDKRDDGSTIHSYTTHDKISGHVVIRFAKDTPFHDIEISFEGTTDTYIDRVASTAPASGRSTGKHRFLRLIQPDDPAVRPPENIARAGVSYEIPFEFVVPERLLDQQCAHQVVNPQVQEAHLQVPPTLGDQTILGDRQAPLDDMAPESAKIRYALRARLIKSRTPSNRLADVAEKLVRIRIVPAREEDPPLDVGRDSKDFELRKENKVRKGLFQGKLGRIVAEAQQPSGFRLRQGAERSRPAVSTMVTVNLRFDPAEERAQPPKLGSLTSRMRAHTFFCSEAFEEFPSRSSLNQWDVERGMYVQSIDLASRCVSSVEWRQHQPSQPASGSTSPRPVSYRSEISFDAAVRIPEPSAVYRPTWPFYTAKILVPMTLPEKKAFPPTFYSCLVSRSYALDLQITYHPPGGGVPTPSLRLTLPIQISAAGNPAAPTTVNPVEAQATAVQGLDQEMAETQLLRRSIISPSSSPTSPGGQPAVDLAPWWVRYHRLGDSPEQDPPAYSSTNGARGLRSRRAQERFPGMDTTPVTTGVLVK